MEILKSMVVQQGNKTMEMEEPAAPHKMVTSGKDKVSLSVYGQVNRMLLNASDGSESRLFHADNDMSSTRVGFKGKAKMDGGWSAGTTIEAQMESNSSAKVHLGDDGDDVNTDLKSPLPSASSSSGSSTRKRASSRLARAAPLLTAWPKRTSPAPASAPASSSDCGAKTASRQEAVREDKGAAAPCGRPRHIYRVRP